MQFPVPQGLSSSSFKQPSLDGSLLLPEILDHHAQHSPDHPLFVYTDKDNTVHTIPWTRAAKAFLRVAHIAHTRVAVASPGSHPVVAVLASADQITYFSVITGLLRAGYQAFPISPRNSDVAVAHLLQKVACSHVFVSVDASMQKLAGSAAMEVSALGGELIIMPMPTFEELFENADAADFAPTLKNIGLDEPAIILHSSGSTAFPKAIKLTFRMLMESGLIPYYGQVDICGEILSIHAVPMFHLMGVITLPWTVFCGLTLAVFPPSFPPIIPSPDRVFDGAIATHSTLIFCVPAFLESWAREPACVNALEKFKTVIFAGAPLQPAVGDMLVQNGVKIAHIYGLTETSNLTMFVPKSPPKEGWDYFYLSSHADLAFLPLENNLDVYHLVAKKCATHTPAVLDTTVDGVPAFKSNDLLLRHPLNDKLWKVFGRQDDQIMHSNGEKTNPVPIEAILLKNSAIKYGIMFGRSKFHAGVIVFPSEPFDPADTQLVIEFRRKIWPTVEDANRFAPTHSRIFKEMILVADPAKPIELTPKGTPRRQAVLNMYETEIKDIYAAVEESSQTHLSAPTEYDSASSLQFIRRVVAEAMVEMPGDDDDIFQHGCDSLQATWIRNSILHALRNSQKINTKSLPGTFVYSHPTPRLLADLLTKLAAGAVSEPEELEAAHARAMEAMVQKYVHGFPQHCGTENPVAQAVFVTGTTGALGVHLLQHLLALPEIQTVYAFNRRATKDIREHHRISFLENAIDAQLLDSAKLKFLEGDLNAPQFGLAREDFDWLKASVTIILHNAWQVNFNHSLSSMEPLVAGTRQLIDFALTSPHISPPRLLFVSSAGVFNNLKGTDVALEQQIHDARTSVGLGYAESKWVAESVLETAAQTTALNPIIVRAGQLSGAANGAWNTSDWFPVLMRSSQLLGQLPTISGRASWVPIHLAAKSLVDMRNSDVRYLHLSHPQPMPIADILSPISNVLGLPLVPYSQWLDSLEAAATQESAASTNPGVRLADFFRAYREGNADQEAFFPVSLSNACAVGFLGSLSPLGAEDVEGWVDYLRRVGYLV
ncbi:hypothetical protein DFH06DRAFT_1429524 [Mycena polygramma]|nr:hypothetical protein DFH06DRAFT_1429524 [Mycena polygramma]